MTEQERELDLQLGDALTKIKMLEEVIKHANNIIKFVEQGKYGDAYRDIQFYYAGLEQLRQWQSKQIDMDGRC
jgi:hypothetical protein